MESIFRFKNIIVYSSYRFLLIKLKVPVPEPKGPSFVTKTPLSYVVDAVGVVGSGSGSSFLQLVKIVPNANAVKSKILFVFDNYFYLFFIKVNC